MRFSICWSRRKWRCWIGRRPEALAASEEAVAAYQVLADPETGNPATYLPDLAMALSNHSLRLGDVGRRPDSLTAIEEAVAIRRVLADPETGNPAAYLPDLAGTLTNHSIHLAESGRPTEALTASEEAPRGRASQSGLH
ncbi:MAG: hypothetical protein ACRCYU_03605 [Nocardioides sp.]